MKIVLLALLVLPLAAQDAVNLTGGALNGHAWLNYNQGEKILFLKGYQEGYAMALLDHGHPVKDEGPNDEPNTTYRDMIQALDTFYSAPENRDIPVYQALTVFKKKLNGAPLLVRRHTQKPCD